MTKTTFRIGELEVTRIEEIGVVPVPPEAFLADPPLESFERARHLMAPEWFDPVTGDVLMSLHSWMVRTPHHIVLIDTCGGNHKERPDTPWLHQLDTPWLDRLVGCGIAPEQVDYVMCTHLHADHVGWNTRLIDGRWVPTFPNARYLFSPKEYEHWRAAAESTEAWGQQGVFEDSVLPCMDAGLVSFVDDGHVVDDSLQVESAIGHTVANTIIRASSSGSTGLFLGDCIHTPIQTLYPDINTRACELPGEARATRRRLLSDAAEHGHLIIPAHFPAPHFGRVTARGDAFAFHPGL